MIGLFLWGSLSLAEPTPLEQTKALSMKLLGEAAKEKALEKAAIQGMISYLDSTLGLGASQLMTEKEKDRYLSYQLGIRDGYGLSVGFIERRGLLIEDVFVDGAAMASGIEYGDLVVALNDHPFTGRTIAEMKALLNQPYEGKGHFDVLRRGKLRRFTVKRSLYRVRNITQEDRFVRINFFGQGAAKELRKIIEESPKEYLILDLRDNEGGLLSEVEKVAGFFLGARTIGYRQYIEGKREQVRSIPSEFMYEKPIYLMTNKGTSAAAELFVSALLYSKRAIVVGERTAGKAAEYHFYPLNSDLFLHIADVELLHLGETSWKGKGIEPSVVVRSATILPSTRSVDVQLETIFQLMKR
ncbi:MAG: S41 family peptidase [Myxococcota bacterium]|nr:S41 family peptidase [Myxococcota bacterium]